MKKSVICLLFIVLGLFYASNVSAQSTVIFFIRSTTSFGEGGWAKVSKNGTEIFDMRGPFKKTMGNVANPSLPLFMYHPAIRKCTFNGEGKVLFGLDYLFSTGNGQESHLAAEIQLNLSQGSIHYIKIAAKGLNDIQFNEITEKEANKLLKDKKYQSLPDYTE